ncbi:MAG: filamentous hemagglutinin N-terminal domain-containing protein [Microcoleaceae cyanobacterium]
MSETHYFQKQRRHVRSSDPLCLSLLQRNIGWIAVIALSPGSALAQIVPDSTLPTNSNVIPNGDVSEIIGGTRAGNNLFHSFEQFSVPTGSTAFFNNATTVESIISRVTGGSLSSIDGLIRANGTANLFLINPNGIVFGPNAALQIGGSFIGSTAESVLFADGSGFGAVNPEIANPLLTVSIPVGLQYGAVPGDIVVQGAGSNLSFGDVGNIVRDNRPVGLQVPTGQTLALIGGNLSLLGGNLTAESGRVSLGSVNSGTVGLSLDELGWSLDYSNLQSFQDIVLLESASVDTSGAPGGNIQVQGRQVALNSGSALLSASTGSNEASSSIDINASELFTVADTNADSTFVSLVSAEVSPGSTNPQGGEINVDAGFLAVAGAGQIFNSTFSSGDSGAISIQADQVLVTGGGLLSGLSTPRGFSSAISTSTSFPGEAGDAGNIQINAENLQVDNGAVINTDTLSSGNAGNITVNAANIELSGTSPSGLTSSGLFSNATSIGTGAAGDIQVTTEQLSVSDGAQITTITAGPGNGGDLTIDAVEVDLSGVGTIAQFGVEIPSGLQVTSEDPGSGQGGNLSLNTERLIVQGGAQIAVATSGTGQSGLLEIQADQVNLLGRSEQLRSGLFSNAIQRTGDGGTIVVDSNQLTIQAGATINASNFPSLDTDTRAPGEGQAGSILIQANTVSLDSPDINDPSTITATTFNGGGGNVTLNVLDSIGVSGGSQILAETRGGGEGGSLSLNTGLLGLSDGASMSTSSQGSGNAGQIEITAGTVVISNQSQILSESQAGASGNGGSIIVTGPLLSLVNQGILSTSTESSGQAGNVNIQTQVTQVDRSSRVLSEAEETATGAGGNLNLTTDQLILTNGGVISTSTLGTGDAGSTTVNATTVDIDGVSTDSSSGIFSGSSEGTIGQGGQIVLNVGQLNLANGGVVNTNTGGTGNAGSIQISTDWANLQNNGSILSEARTGSTGDGGNINVSVNNILTLRDSGQISTSSEGLGQAGNITANASQIQLDRGEITATSVETGGGDIGLTTNFLEMQNGSLISTSVTDSTGGGGDLTIERDFVLAQAGSTIEADAVFGPGGNITILTQGIFLAGGSRITASSEFGVDGIVDISNPDTERKVGTVQLPEKVTDVSQLIATGCATDARNSFVVTGRGGLPEDPQQILQGEVVWSDLRSDLRQSEVVTQPSSSGNRLGLTQDPDQGPQSQTTSTPIVEAQAWIMNAQGNLELVARSPGVAYSSNRPIHQPLSCVGVRTHHE